MRLRIYVILLSTLVVLAYVISLTRAFPGKFHPLTPHHPDLYQYVGLLSRPALRVAANLLPVPSRQTEREGVERHYAGSIASVRRPGSFLST